MDATTAKALLQRYLEGDASHEEIILIEQWYQQLVDAGEWNWAEGEREQLQATMESRLLEQIAEQPRTRVLWLTKRSLGAAAVLLLLITGAWLLFTRKTTQPIASLSQRYRNDVRPGRNAAVLTLAGGKTVVLDASAPKTIGSQGNVVILNDSGQLVYQAKAGKESEIFYNTLTTQKGNQYHLTLPDGTKVWLNAVSSITYPTAFAGKERRVTISGEAYFEVMKNQQKPFIVQEGDMNVEVLGTSFDVNGYGDEAALKTTLVDGKVRVEKGAAASMLEPGEQAVIANSNAGISIDHNPDIEAVLAWKNGSFAFKDASIAAIMQQVQRWYDVDVIYEANITKHFVADIPRNVPLSQLLQLLEATDQVHFRVEGKKVFVMQ
ncbi:FecR family protein [Puia dinghuensis]|uniref:Iron dicitrate transporter FecR n=1 Tax=Puia dinghuensis TaxID=1792502 RepID=A0A8J2XTA4_9BACT|nr:FecR family protein [Puia dinghuensis]GGB02485.1 iron dicitrate transporter FecR [Puia dinghuensis]